MARPLRIEFAGALYHVTARGDRRQAIYRDDIDRQLWLDTLAKACAKYAFRVYAFCLMPNHYHLLVETASGQLAAGMRQLNGVYSQAYNRRHDQVGHVFQGRYHAILCAKQSYLLEVARYIVLNPVRAGMVAAAADWPWSSHRWVLDEGPAPHWFSPDVLLAHFGNDQSAARQAYRIFVAAGVGARRPFDNVTRQLYLGAMPEAAKHVVDQALHASPEISRAHKQAVAMPLAAYFSAGTSLEAAVARAYQSNCFSLAEIARHCGCSRRTIARLIQHNHAGKQKKN